MKCYCCENREATKIMTVDNAEYGVCEDCLSVVIKKTKEINKDYKGYQKLLKKIRG